MGVGYWYYECIVILVFLCVGQDWIKIIVGASI